MPDIIPPKAVVAADYQSFTEWRDEHWPNVSPLDFIVVRTDRRYSVDRLRGRSLKPDQVVWLDGAAQGPMAAAVRAELDIQAAGPA